MGGGASQARGKEIQRNLSRVYGIMAKQDTGGMGATEKEVRREAAIGRAACWRQQEMQQLVLCCDGGVAMPCCCGWSIWRATHTILVLEAPRDTDIPAVRS